MLPLFFCGAQSLSEDHWYNMYLSGVRGGGGGGGAAKTQPMFHVSDERADE